MEVIGICPICQERLNVAKLHCNHCGIEISGDFQLSKFSYLDKQELRFVELFLANQGNIKGVERDLGISYPTVKKMLEQVIRKLELPMRVDDETTRRRELMEKVARGELKAEEAAKLME